MADEQITLVLLAKDEASAVLRRLTAQTVSTEKEIEASNKRLVASGQSAATATAHHLNTISTGLGFMGVAAAGFAVKSAASYEKAINASVAFAGLSERDSKRVSAAILDMSQKVGISATTAAQGYYNLQSAGLKGRDAQIALAAAMKASAASQTDLATTTDVLTTVTKAYGLSGNQIKAAQDDLTMSVNLGKQSFAELATSLGGVIPLAAQMGVGTKELGAILAVTTNQGINTAESVAGIRNALNTLAAPTKQQLETMKGLGITMDDINVHSHGLIGVFDNIQKALDKGHLSAQEQDNALAHLFRNNSEASRTFMATMTQGGAQVHSAFEKMQHDAGATGESFRKAATTTAHQWDVAKASVEVLAIRVGNVLLPVVNQLFHEVTPVVKSISEWVSQNRGAVSSAVTLATKVGGLVLAYKGLKTAMAISAEARALMTSLGLVAGAEARAATQANMLSGALVGGGAARGGGGGNVSGLITGAAAGGSMRLGGSAVGGLAGALLLVGGAQIGVEQSAIRAGNAQAELGRKAELVKQGMKPAQAAIVAHYEALQKDGKTISGWVSNADMLAFGMEKDTKAALAAYYALQKHNAELDRLNRLTKTRNDMISAAASDPFSGNETREAGRGGGAAPTAGLPASAKTYLDDAIASAQKAVDKWVNIVAYAAKTHSASLEADRKKLDEAKATLERLNKQQDKLTQTAEQTAKAHDKASAATDKHTVTVQKNDTALFNLGNRLDTAGTAISQSGYDFKQAGLTVIAAGKAYDQQMRAFGGDVKSAGDAITHFAQKADLNTLASRFTVTGRAVELAGRKFDPLSNALGDAGRGITGATITATTALKSFTSAITYTARIQGQASESFRKLAEAIAQGDPPEKIARLAAKAEAAASAEDHLASSSEKAAQMIAFMTGKGYDLATVFSQIPTTIAGIFGIATGQGDAATAGTTGPPGETGTKGPTAQRPGQSGSPGRPTTPSSPGVHTRVLTGYAANPNGGPPTPIWQWGYYTPDGQFIPDAVQPGQAAGAIGGGGSGGFAGNPAAQFPSTILMPGTVTPGGVLGKGQQTQPYTKTETRWEWDDATQKAMQVTYQVTYAPDGSEINRKRLTPRTDLSNAEDQYPLTQANGQPWPAAANNPYPMGSADWVQFNARAGGGVLGAGGAGSATDSTAATDPLQTTNDLLQQSLDEQKKQTDALQEQNENWMRLVSNLVRVNNIDLDRVPGGAGLRDFLRGSSSLRLQARGAR